VRVSYRSVRALFVGVLLIQVNRCSKNWDRVLVDAIAATNDCQSPVFKSASGGKENFPSGLTLSVGVASVQGNAIRIEHGRVEVALHLINGLRHKAQAQLGVSVEVVQKA